MNGEQKKISLTHISSDFYENNKFNISKFIENYKKYVKRRDFKPFFIRFVSSQATVHNVKMLIIRHESQKFKHQQ